MCLKRVLVVLAIGYFIFIGWVIYLVNTGQKSVFFELVAVIPYGDKVGHFCLFGFLSLFLNLAFKFKTWAVASLKLYWGALIVLTFVTFEELSQYLIVTRRFDFADYISALLGIGVFSWLCYFYRKQVAKKQPVD
ncbi:VanZ family protein [Pseudoalteromonas mariniglutinosa]|uniref:VanZ family protein n=1 Tax=Pseudoalteromonas mariniglutinosa TaxID=206042 RepID=UPI00384D3EFD